MAGGWRFFAAALAVVPASSATAFDTVPEYTPGARTKVFRVRVQVLAGG
jgi:hypothetical protein